MDWLIDCQAEWLIDWPIKSHSRTIKINNQAGMQAVIQDAASLTRIFSFCSLQKSLTLSASLRPPQFMVFIRVAWLSISSNMSRPRNSGRRGLSKLLQKLLSDFRDYKLRGGCPLDWEKLQNRPFSGSSRSFEIHHEMMWDVALSQHRTKFLWIA